MGLQLVTPPTTEPIALDDAKLYLRIDFDDDDDLITSQIPQVRAYLERMTGQAFLTQTWRYSIDRFPGNVPFAQSNPDFWLANPLFGWNAIVGQAFDPVWDRAQALPYHRHDTIYVPKKPIQSIQSITYLDTNGQSQTLSTSVYNVDLSGDPARIRLAQGQSWPWTLEDIGTVQVNFVAGYGDDASSIPADFLRGMYMMLGYTYQSREAVIAEYRITPTELPLGVQALIQATQRPMLA